MRAISAIMAVLAIAWADESFLSKEPGVFEARLWRIKGDRWFGQDRG
ncbi:MAG TPA: hypothetical protein V6D27_05310 [Vampirovibrionales bacterium]